jgi:ATP-dependent helicase/nuclease subunit B
MTLPETLAANCERLESEGFTQQADEGRQLWGIICRALDNCADILGVCSPQAFEQFFALCLSQYQVGAIPVALDRLHIGPMDRLRKLNLTCLILLGASEGFMPRVTEAPGLLTDEERVLLEENGCSLSPRADERASRELLTLYRCFSMPHERLAVSRALNVDNMPAHPSLFFTRLSEITGVPVHRAAAVSPSGSSEWLSDRAPLGGERRERLCRDGCLSASGVQAYQTCRFRYFAQYALSARGRPLPGPQPSDAGTIIHAVLESMVNRVMERGGFQAVDRAAALELAAGEARRYISELPGVELQTARTNRLLERLSGTALSVAGSVYDELSRSEFKPLAAELPFKASLSPGGFPLRGIADRVDGWVRDGSVYLRVTDYKSGSAGFSLSDVWHGLGIQTLCYLFALEEWGGLPALPAGVLYLPAHDRFVSAGSRNAAPEEVLRLRGKSLRRDGLILDDIKVADAMEPGARKEFIPVNYKDGKPDARSKSAGMKRMELLRAHVARVLEGISRDMRSGRVDAAPILRSASERACDYCDIKQACLFDESRETYRFLPPIDRNGVWELLEKAESL